MNKTRAFRILIPAALALTSAGFAQASADEVPRMSNDVPHVGVVLLERRGRREDRVRAT